MSGTVPAAPTARLRSPPGATALTSRDAFKTATPGADTSTVTAEKHPSATTGTGAPVGPGGHVDAEALTATILKAVERQLTKHFATMSKQAEAAQELAASTKAHLDERIPLIEAAVDAQREGIEAYQIALQQALEERLSEFANHQHWRLKDLEERIEQVPMDAPGISAEDMLEIRQTVRDDMERSFSAIHAKLDDLGQTQRRADEQATTLAAHVQETTASLSQRIADGDQQITTAVEELLANVQEVFGTTLADIEAQVAEHTGTLLQKLEQAETRATDRLLALEARINEDQGTKLANLEAAVGRLGAGFDDAMVALNQRVLEVENRLHLLSEQYESLTEIVSHIDQDAIEDLKSQMSNAVGEAMLVRIEVDRVVKSTEERFDKQAVRMTEIEAMLTDELDVGTAVQLERLDELERAMAMLDPSRFAGSPAAAIVADAPDEPAGAATSMFGTSLNLRLPGADASTNGAGEPHAATNETHDQDHTFSSY